MGPFPHDAPKSVLTKDNPAGTDGFEFVEFASPEPQELRDLFTRMGYARVARHKTQKIDLWQQGDITYVLNHDPDSFAARFVAEHGPCAPSMGWRVVDAQKAFDHAVAKGAEPYEGDGKVLDVPAIVGIGGSLLYFVDQYYDTSPYNEEYDWVAQSKPEGVGFTTSITSRTMCTGATWTNGSSSTATCSISVKSGSLTSKASLPGCTAAR